MTRSISPRKMSITFLTPGSPPATRAIARRRAEEDELGAEAEGDQDGGAAAHAAVEHHGHLVADCRLDRRQSLERGRCLVKLAAAVVRDDDAVGPDFCGANRVSRVQDAL